jgi:uncharacterized protein with ParB-like and HNH nuclease domain
MESQLFSISKIFTERILRIPDYQRGYAWNDKQLKDFWTDLTQLEPHKNHYTGVLTLEAVPSNIVKTWEEDYWIVCSKSYSPFYVVDGQQRLTTIIILIQSITEVIKENKKLNYTSTSEIRKKFIFDSKDDGISRSYLFGYEKDNPSYEFLKRKIFLEHSDNSFSIQETIYTSNLENSRNFFLEKLKPLDITQIEDIYQKITQRFLFNIYTISNDIDVCVAFETMNNRGKPLSHLELLKNRLIYLSTKFEGDASESQKLRNTVNEAWKSIYHYLGKNKNNPLDDDVFLLNHFVSYYGNRLIESQNLAPRYILRMYRVLHQEYLLERVFTVSNICLNSSSKAQHNSLIDLKDIYEYVRNLKDSVEIWFYLLNPEISEFDDDIKIWLEKLNRLGILSCSQLIMVFFKISSDPKLRLKLLKSLERNLFITHFVKNSAYISVREDRFIDLSLQLGDSAISPENAIKQIDKTSNIITSDADLIKTVIQQFNKNGFYKWSGIRYFLYEYELSLKMKSKTYRDKIKWSEYIDDRRDYHTVEHIYPQRPKKDCWTKKYDKYSDSERTALRHSLGNLVPLSQPKNSSFQNKCFADKKAGEGNCIGFSYGSYSENEIAQYTDWTAKEILMRGLKLLEFMERRWSLDLGSPEEKLFCLNVKFVTKKESLESKDL